MLQERILAGQDGFNLTASKYPFEVTNATHKKTKKRPLSVSQKDTANVKFINTSEGMEDHVPCNKKNQ